MMTSKILRNGLERSLPVADKFLPKQGTNVGIHDITFYRDTFCRILEIFLSEKIKK